VAATPTAMQRKAVGAAFKAVRGSSGCVRAWGRGRHRPAGNEGRQTVDVTSFVRDGGLWGRLNRGTRLEGLLRLLAVAPLVAVAIAPVTVAPVTVSPVTVATAFAAIARLEALLARLISMLALAAGLMLIGLLALFARLIRLGLLARRVRLAAHAEFGAFVVALVADTVARLAIHRLVLAELLLHRSDQAEVVFGVLVVVFRRNRIAGRLRVTGELDVLFCHMIGRAADLHVRAVRFINACERILTFAVLAAPPHTLVLTVSHGVLLHQPPVGDGFNRRYL
jgi:hypothetical protein